MASRRPTNQAALRQDFASWLIALSQRCSGRSLSTPTAAQLTAYSERAGEKHSEYRVSDVLTPGGDRHKLRRVIAGSVWDARGLLQQAALEFMGDDRVDFLVLGTTAVAHASHDDTVIDLHAVAGARAVPVAWRRLRDDELRDEARVAAEMVDEALVELGLRPTSAAAPPVLCPDLLGDEHLRARLARLGLEYVVAVPSEYARMELGVDANTFWRTESVLGYELQDGAGAQPVRLRARSGSRPTGTSHEWACADHASKPPRCWIVHPVLRGAAAASPLQSSRARQRATQLAELRHSLPAGERARRLGAHLFSFDDPQGWERDTVLRSLRQIFEQLDV